MTLGLRRVLTATHSTGDASLRFPPPVISDQRGFQLFQRRSRKAHQAAYVSVSFKAKGLRREIIDNRAKIENNILVCKFSQNTVIIGPRLYERFRARGGVDLTSEGQGRV